MSLINDALKRASDSQAQAQAQAATRPRGPKGVEDLPVPMTPVSAPERRAWVPVVGIGLVLLALLGASAFFFEKWWSARKNFQPYADENLDEHGMPRTNAVAKVEPPKVEPPKVTPATPTNPPVATNPPSVVVIPPEPPKTNPPLIAVVVPPVIPPPVVPPPVIPVPVPVIATNPVVPPPLATNAVPPNVEPVVIAQTNAPPRPPPPPIPTKSVVPPPAVEFPELKLQGISRGKKKTFVTVNGKTLSLGDRIEGVTLLKIEADSVTVEKGGAKRELFLLR